MPHEILRRKESSLNSRTRHATFDKNYTDMATTSDENSSKSHLSTLVYPDIKIQRIQRKEML